MEAGASHVAARWLLVATENDESRGEMNSDIESSPRFQRPVERRDWLGLASMWSACAAFFVALIGALRLPMPSVLPESSSRVKLGPVDQFVGTAVTPFPELRLWIFSDPRGLVAMSAICTHLGCTVKRQSEGGFFCPCHGSRYDAQGKNVSGPAPKPLRRLELFVAPDGQLVVDRKKEVGRDVRLVV